MTFLTIDDKGRITETVSDPKRKPCDSGMIRLDKIGWLSK